MIERVPDGVPRWAWFAARDLYDRMEEIDGEAMNDAQVAQDPEEGEWTWCLRVAEIVESHRLAAEKAAQHVAGKKR